MTFKQRNLIKQVALQFVFGLTVFPDYLDTTDNRKGVDTPNLTLPLQPHITHLKHNTTMATI